MACRGKFTDLKDDNFWGNREDENSADDKGSEEERVESQKDLTEHVEEVEDTTWENVKTPKHCEDKERGPFGVHRQFGGFSRTNAAEYFEDEKAWKTGKEQRNDRNQRAPTQPMLNSPEKENGWQQPDVNYLVLPQSSSTKVGVNLLDSHLVDYYQLICRGLDQLSDQGVVDDLCDETSPDGMPTTTCGALQSKYYTQYNLGPEIFSRKVFVGGLSAEMDEHALIANFARFGPVSVCWPNKTNGKGQSQPKGYVFLVFEHETSVRGLVEECNEEEEKMFLHILSPNMIKLKVQIRPWRLADADYLVDVNAPVDLRKVVFVGGVPRPIRAVELAHMMDRLYGSVACAGIDTDVEYKYPKGAGRVAFTNQNSYMRAITDRFAYLSHGEEDKRLKVEMKPYVLDDQSCDECRDEGRSRHAPFFCPDLDCLQYYCESCWTALHGSARRSHHRPLFKES